MTSGAGSLRQVVGKVRHRLRRDLRYPLARRLPLRDVVLFESWQGKQYSDNPRAISETLARVRPDLEQVWVLRGDPPPGVRAVRRWSAAYYDALARSRWIVANDTLDRRYVKRPGTTYVQTWHGTPVKRLGHDLPVLRSRDTTYLDHLDHDVAAWDLLVSPNAFSTAVFRRAFRYDGEVVESGYPRNDLLSAPDRDAVREKVRDALGVGDRKVLLWLPTWRDHLHAEVGYQFTMGLDVEAARAALSPGWLLLVRGHHHTAASMPPLGDDFVRDVTDHPDVRELYLAADVLVSDYSSAMFDFAVTGRPVVVFAWDLDEYRDDVRGFYLDLETEGPGPLVRTTLQLVEAVRDLDTLRARGADRLAAWRERFCALEDGHAAERVVARVFG